MVWFFSFLALIQMAYVCFGQNFTAILFKIVSLIARATNQFTSTAFPELDAKALVKNCLAFFSLQGQVQSKKPGFHMTGKSQMIARVISDDFAMFIIIIILHI